MAKAKKKQGFPFFGPFFGGSFIWIILFFLLFFGFEDDFF